MTKTTQQLDDCDQFKCDGCKHLQGEGASTDYPYPHTWCGKGHWEGGDPSEVTEDPWADCIDFEPEQIGSAGE